MMHNFHEYEYLKNVLEYTNTEYIGPRSDVNHYQRFDWRIQVLHDA